MARILALVIGLLSAGVIKGMTFHLVQPDAHRILVIDTVGKGRSEGDVYIRSPSDRLPAVGWRFASRTAKAR